MSRYGDQAHVPVRGWHYFDGEDWLEDLYLTMSGTYHIITSAYNTIKYNKIQYDAEGSPHYPDLLSVRSSGPVADLLPSYLGLYRRLDNISHSSRPVWGHSERGDRFLLFQGEIFIVRSYL